MIKPHQIAKTSEHSHQSAFFAWFNVNIPLLRRVSFAIPNGASTGVVNKALLKAEGLTSGVCDVFISYPVKPYHGMYIEFKRYDGVLSVNQEQFIINVTNNGYHCVVVVLWYDAVCELCSYLNLNYSLVFDYKGTVIDVNVNK